MDRLISLQAAIDAFDGVKVDEEDCTEYDIGYNDGIDFAVSKLSVLPSARPIGKWELQESGHIENIYLCSNCKNYEAWGETEKTPFCPHCGAWMEV